MSVLVSLLTLLAIALPLGNPPSAGAAKPITIDRIVAKINDDIITLSELQKAIAEEADKLRQTYRGKEFQRRRRELELQALDILIEHKLILQRAKTLQASIQDKDLESAINAILERNKITSDKLREYLVSKGTTLESFREKIRESLLMRQVEGVDVNIRVSVSESEIAEYYHANIDQYRKGETRHVQQIFFPVESDASQDVVDDQREKANKAYLEATRNGTDFGSLAKKISEGPAASRGGDLGFIKKGEVFPEFETAVFGLAVGKVAKPVRTRAGFHVLRVSEVKPGEVITLDRVAGQIQDRLFREKRAKRRREWIAELKRAAFLEIDYGPQLTGAKDGGLDSLFRDVREQVTFQLVGVELTAPAELFVREKVFWAYGANRRYPRWKTGELKLDAKRRLEAEDISSVSRMHREFVNPDPAANLYLFEHNYLLPNAYLGKISFADLIKTYSMNSKKKRFEMETDSKKVRLVFDVKVEKTRSIVADTKELSR